MSVIHQGGGKMRISRTVPIAVTLLMLGTITLLIAQEPIVAAFEIISLPGLLITGLGLGMAAAIGLGLMAWLGYEQIAERRARRRLAEAEAALKDAEARKVRRDSDVYVITAPKDHAVYISDAPGLWRAAHIDPRRYANGPASGDQPHAVELAAWSQWHQVHATAKQLSPPIETEQLAAPAQWPSRIDLLELLPHGPSLSNVVLGVTVDAAGQRQTVSASLSKLVHIAVGGSSGWGKSVFLRALAYQLIAAPEVIELAFIDLEATTFAPFATASRLRCAIADTEHAALGILSNLTHELEYRKRLFKGYPTVEKLSDYNQQAKAPLPIVALLIDEATALLADKAIEEQIRTLALRARKYGIYAIMGGQDWKAASLDTAIRNQLSTRIQFKAQDGAQSRVLLGTSEAARIEHIGRAYAVLPGRPRIEIQAPHIDLATIAVPAGTSEAPPPPPEPEPTELERQILALHDADASHAKICETVWGYKSSKKYPEIDAVLERYGRI